MPTMFRTFADPLGKTAEPVQFFYWFFPMVADGSTVASVADRAFQRPKTAANHGVFSARAATSLSAVLAVGASFQR